MNRPNQRLAFAFAFFALAALMVGIHHVTVSGATSLTFHTFASFPQYYSTAGIGFSEPLDRLIVACSSGLSGCENNACAGAVGCVFEMNLDQVDSSGAVTAFARLPDPSPSDVPLAVSPGLGGFANGTVVVGLNATNPTITKVSSDGSVVTLVWSTCAAATLGSEARFGGLAFDTVGLFGYDLLALSSDGKLFRVTSTSACSLVADAGPSLFAGGGFAEALAVAPASFGPLAGEAIIGACIGGGACGGYGELVAVSSTGVVTPMVGGFVFNGDHPEHLNFVLSAASSLYETGSDEIAVGTPFTSSDVGTLIVGTYWASIYQIKFDGNAGKYV